MSEERIVSVVKAFTTTGVNTVLSIPAELKIKNGTRFLVKTDGKRIIYEQL